jgi:hypothetical protein
MSASLSCTDDSLGHVRSIRCSVASHRLYLSYAVTMVDMTSAGSMKKILHAAAMSKVLLPSSICFTSPL